VWQGSETGSELEAMTSNLSSPSTSQQGAGPEESRVDWEGWEWVENTVRYLNEGQRSPRHSAYDTQPSVKPEPGVIKEPAANAEQAQRPNSNSRMTIASII
jgi:hypothetical protein